MLTTTDESQTYAVLRQIAEFRLREATAHGTRSREIWIAALTHLLNPSSDPAMASDSLKLLHELQVHQIELDLQHEHMEEDRRALEESARYHTELYELAPVAYFTVNKANRIIEGNCAGARMLGVERHYLDDHRVDGLVAPDSRPALLTLLDQVRSSGLRHSVKAQAEDADGSKWLQLAANISPCGQFCMLVVMDLSDAHQ